ncbi:MAG: tetratricopeptide repeat protein [Myxococcaceae bacterium]
MNLIKNTALAFCLIGISNVFADQIWKSSGEYFENKYLLSLREKPLSILPLKQAFLIYRIEAQKGDADAQFRLGALYEQGGLKEEAKNWFKKAAAGGHEYATIYLKALSNNEQTDSNKFCKFLGGLLESGKKTSTDSLHYVESLALLENTNCMLSLGRYKESSYWLQRATLTAPTKELEGEASYELGLILKEDSSCHPKLFLSHIERAVRCEHAKARNWLKTYRTADGILAYSQFLQDLGQPIYAEAVLRGLSDQPQSSDPWSIRDRHTDAGKKAAIDLYRKSVVQSLLESSKISSEITSETIRDLLAVVQKEPLFVEPILTLYEFADPIKFTQNNEILELVTSWASSLKVSSEINSLKQFALTLKVRRLLASTSDISNLDIILNELLRKYDFSDETFLKATLEVNSKDLLLFFFKKVFSNELSQLELSMQLEDLFTGVASLYPGKQQTLRALEILSSVKTRNSKPIDSHEFPKLSLLEKSGFDMQNLELTPKTSLFAESIFTVNRYANAYQQYQETGFYFWNHGLEATLSNQRIEMIKNQLLSTQQTLSEMIQEFRQHRNDINWLQDSENNKRLAKQSLENSLQLKKEHLKKDIAEIFATQKTLDKDLDYDGLFSERKEALKNSKSVRVFETQLIPQESQAFSVKPKDAQVSNWASHLSIEVDKNEVLNIGVHGEWSPTCALERSKLFDGVEKASTGPEGFRIQLAQGDSFVLGNDQRNSSSHFSTSSTTESFGLSASGSAYGFGFSASHTSQQTTGTSKVSEESKYKQNSNFKTKTAAFQSGIRLGDTPYPDFPAGSYLAVVVSREIKNFAEVIDVFVIGTHRSYVARQNSTVYFVVNDCNDGKVRSGILDVQLKKLKPASGEVAKIIDAMVDELWNMNRAGDALVQEGGDLSSRIQKLKSGAFANLQASTLVELRSEPTLLSTFQHWLDHEADKIVRKARILELTRSIKLTKLEMDGILKQLDTAQGHASHVSSRLGALVKHVRHFPLYDTLLRAIREATEYLLPILKLYYPSGKSFINSDAMRVYFIKENDAFALETMAVQTKNLVGQLLSGLNTKTLAEETGKYIILRIPRPGSYLDDSEKELVPMISEERAKILWDHLFAEKFDPNSWGLKIQIRDLYQSKRLSVLDKTEESPIIVDMALLFSVEDFGVAANLQRQLYTGTLDMYVDREQSFPMLKGIEKLVLSNEARLKYTISLGFVYSQDHIMSAVERIKSDISTGLNTAKGLSPFTAFRFGVENRIPLNSIRRDFGIAEDGYPNLLKHIYLIIKVVSTTHGKPMEWIQ